MVRRKTTGSEPRRTGAFGGRLEAIKHTAVIAVIAAAALSAICPAAHAKTKSQIPMIGVRPQGMGNAFVAIADDVNAIYWNPAGLSTLNKEKRQLMIAHDDRFGFGIDENTVSYAQTNFGFSWSHLGVGDEFLFGADYSQDTFVLSYSQQIDPQLYAGINVKYFKQRFQKPSDANLTNAGHTSVATGEPDVARDVNADGQALDIGFLYVVDKATTIGLLVRDFGNGEAEGIKYDKKDHFEPVITLGFARRPNEITLFSLQVNHSMDEFRIQGGVEYTLQEQIKLRLGLDDEIITAGVGLYYEDWEIDYAFKNKTDQGLDKTQLIGATVKF